MSQDKRVRLAGATLDRSRHVCAFFNSKKEEYRVLLPFVPPDEMLRELQGRSGQGVGN